MKFDTSSETKEFIESLHPRVRARNQAIVGRVALFLALREGVPSDFKPKDAKGGTLNDEQVVGDELNDLVHAALNFRAGKMLVDESSYRQMFRLYFEYGCFRLKQIWDESRSDQVRFVKELLKYGKEVNLGLSSNKKTQIKTLPVVEKEVKLKVLEDAPDWSVNGPNTNNGLLVISGQSGSGKSQLALDLLAQISQNGVRFIFFDLKGELEENKDNLQQQENRKKFLEVTGASYIRLIQQPLPINPFYRATKSAENAQVAHEIANIIRCFAPQLGANQERIIADSYKKLRNPDMESLANELRSSGAEGVGLSIITKIQDYNLFANSKSAISQDEWLQNSLVIDFKQFGTDNETKALATALILNYLIKKFGRQEAVREGVQPLKVVLFVDEAHLLLPKEHKAGLLSQLARQGRSWGFPIWLASQDADKFLTQGANETNFAQLAECGVYFSPQTLKESDQKKIFGKIINRNLEKGEAVLCFGGKYQGIGKARKFCDAWK